MLLQFWGWIAPLAHEKNLVFAKSITQKSLHACCLSQVHSMISRLIFSNM